jgi:hypothetical protein
MASPRGDQPLLKDRQGARPDDPAVGPAAGGSGDRVKQIGLKSVKLETVDLEVADEMAHEVGEAQLTLASGRTQTDNGVSIETSGTPRRHSDGGIAAVLSRHTPVE